MEDRKVAKGNIKK